MKHLFRKMVKVLDSQPKGAKGQSLVELALTAPILFMMIVSTAEVGFLANNYLILLDAVREGGRYAVTQNPVAWAVDPNATTGDPLTRNQERTDCDTTVNSYDLRYGRTDPPHGPAGYTSTASGEGPIEFFDGTACQVIQAMDPLYFNLNTDDVVVSAIGFANQCQENNDAQCYADPEKHQPIGTRTMRVAGRWPLTNRRCADDTRDPFAVPNTAGVIPKPGATAPFTIRGFVVTGKQITDSGCIGSKFFVGPDSGTGTNEFDLNGRFNALPDVSVRNNIPNGGMVIVEMTWMHHQLFNFPPFNLIGSNGNIPLYIWMMFPVTAAEPTATDG